ncbi:MAG: hypothetical protein AB8F94_22075 [Saprospiraceae bacterium]
MKNKKFPLTQVTISNKIGRSINSIVWMSNLKYFYIRPDFFLQTFVDFFDELPWEKNASEKTSLRKNVSITFSVSLKGLSFFMEKKEEANFPIDYFFKKGLHHKPIHHLFGSVFSQFYKFIKNELPKDLMNIEIHFIREKVLKGMEKKIEFEHPNSEGSIIILQQENILGGESQILEKMDDNSTEVIFQQKLVAGDFVFLKNKNENKQNISHQLTPIKLADETKQSGWMDLMRFEIVD